MIFLLFAVFLIYYVVSYYLWVRKFPKGPLPLPFIGNLYQITPKDLDKQFRKMAAQYGDVFTVFLPKPFIVLTSYEAIKEAYATKGEDFFGRSGLFPNTLFQQTGKNGGILFSQGDHWKEVRRQSLHILRDFGMGKNLMEEQVKYCLHEFLEHLQSIKDKDCIDMRWPIQAFVGNVINKTLYNYFYSFNDCERLKLFAVTVSTLAENVRSCGFSYLITMWPWLSKAPVVGWLGEGRFMKISQTMKQIVREDVEAVLKDYNPHDEPTCFIQAYYQRTFNDPEQTKQIVDVAMDFFLAGSETTSTTLRWALDFLATNPDVQERMRQEIHSVCGHERLPTCADRSKMPLTNAAIMEVQRLASILPLNLIHRAVRDTSVQGHFVPEDTLIWGQVDAVMYKDPLFKNPDEFDPSRFLLADGKTPNKEIVDRMCAFSIGKRQCAGEGLAKMELFLCLSALLQRYRVAPASGWNIDLSGKFGAVRLPHDNLHKLTPIDTDA